ncbi:MAG: asparagine synthase (glutamine-hydrolyzing) [Oscillospiraceae bacterium]|nr:asparagine synthase (glutamine-hydrolyzing) [Oscillospiraceae bacterium]
MCGIAGELRFDRRIDPNAAYLSAMQEAIAPRGPDQAGSFFADHCALLHRRLAVIDPEGGLQPMHFSGLTIVYNGELYNAPELREQLIQAGYHFLTRSDTEVVLKAYHCYGSAACERFNGIFAFAVYEHLSRRLFLARDPMGVKPLFYAQRGQGLIFASELKALLCHPQIEPEITREGLYDLLLLGPGRTPGLGVFRDVQELLPGQWGLFDEQGLQLRRYFTLTDAPCEEDFETAAAHTRELVWDAVRRQLCSDRPLGCFLSGGLDSSIISAVTARELGKVDTFSVDYPENDRYFRAGKFQPDSDNAYVEIMREVLPGRHRTVILDTDTLVDALFRAVDARDLPGMADIDASMLLLCRAARHEKTVILSGECADEVFGGYPWYRDPEIRAQSGFPWAQNTAYRALFLRPEVRWDIAPEDYVRQRYADTVAQADVLPGTPPLERRMKEMMLLNLQWFMQTLLDRKDRMSMYSGLEVRVPFCDRRLVQYLYTLPWVYKDHRGREKGLLREAFRDLLPEQVLWRKKSPYPKTWRPDYLEAVQTLLRAELQDPDSPLLALFDRGALDALLSEQRSVPWYGQLMTTPQTIAYFVQIAYWLRKFKIRLV